MRKPDASLRIELAATIGAGFGYGFDRSSSIRKTYFAFDLAAINAWQPTNGGSGTARRLMRNHRAVSLPRGEITVHFVLRELRTEVRKKFKDLAGIFCIGV